MDNNKYPRTPHLPFSKGMMSDDKMVGDDWEQYIINCPIVITEKLDGQNCCLTKYGVYARSHATFTDNPWDTNLTGYNGLHSQIKNLLNKDECIYGENLYAIHSIEYDNLPSYFFMFGMRSGDQFHSWNYTKYFSNLSGIPLVPALFKGKINSVKNLEYLINTLMEQGSSYGNTIEGVVVRSLGEFKVKNFSKHVCKYVRENHVQTDQHWTKNWKRAKLIWEQPNIKYLNY
jgi:hypothetical protein